MLILESPIFIYGEYVKKNSEVITKTHVGDYYLFDKQTNTHHLIELKISGDLDNKKARSEKEELLIGKDFWNLVCCSDRGYEIVIDEYKKSAYIINNY